MRACVPVPSSSTTFPRISRICAEVFGERTRRSSRGSPRNTVFPSGSRISRTRYGFITFPPLTTAAIPAASCSGVTEIPWPKATVARRMRLSKPRRDGASPGTSPCSSIPVRDPKPKARIMS